MTHTTQSDRLEELKREIVSAVADHLFRELKAIRPHANHTVEKLGAASRDLAEQDVQALITTAQNSILDEAIARRETMSRDTAEESKIVLGEQVEAVPIAALEALKKKGGKP